MYHSVLYSKNLSYLKISYLKLSNIIYNVKEYEKLLKEKQDAAKIINYIKEGTEDTKLRENASIELYQKLQSPITTKLETEIEKLGKKMEDVSFPFMYDRIS